MKLLGRTKFKITKNKDCENLPYLEINEVVLVHCIIVSNNYEQNSRNLYTFVANNTWSIIRYFTQKFKIFKNSPLSMVIY